MISLVLLSLPLQSVPVEALLRRGVPACLKFLQSFKAFFDRQTAGRTNTLKGRKGRSIGPVAPGIYPFN